MWNLREMMEGDLEAALALWREMPGISLNATDHPDCLRAFLLRNPGLSFVASTPEGLAGAVLCGHDGRRGFLYHLAVAPQFRRQGLGRLLVEHCLRQLSGLGIQRCHIVILADNHAGEAFWERLDFGRRPELTLMSHRLDEPRSR